MIAKNVSTYEHFKLKETNKPEVLDSGERYVNKNGGQRDSSEGKPNFKYVPYDLLEILLEKFTGFEEVVKYIRKNIIIDKIPNKKDLIFVINTTLAYIGKGDIYIGLEKFTLFMEKCANKYSYENWRKLITGQDMERFKESLLRHAVKVLFDRADEYHAEAVVFNSMCLLLNDFEYEKNDL